VNKIKKDKQISYVVRVGPLLMALLEKQLEGIRNVTYDVCHSSFLESGEIIAKKFNGEV
jgi:hypothetical protein